MKSNGGQVTDIDRLLARWSVVPDGVPLRTESGSIVPVRRGSRQLLIKIADGRPVDHADSWRVLRHFGGRGAVEALEISAEGAILMERAVPGTILSDLVAGGHDDEAMVALCQVARALHSQPSPATGAFRTVTARRVDFDGAEAFAGVVGGRFLDRAHHTFAELAASQSDPRLLHGDLHHDNIVLDATRGWLAIDPIGLVGEPAFEIAAAFRNPSETPPWTVTAPIIERRISIAVETLGVDRDRLRGWIFAESVLLAIWSIRNGFDPDGFLMVAQMTVGGRG